MSPGTKKKYPFKKLTSASHIARKNLSIAQNEKLNELITRISKAGKMTKFTDERCLCRYLRARDWDVSKAEKMLLNSLDWREQEKPRSKNPCLLQEEVSTGKLFTHGKDKFGRPCIYMIPRNENSKDYQKNIDLLIYTIERALDEMKGETEQMVLMIDFKGFNTRNTPPLSVSRKTLDILSNQYPERLGKAFMIDCPFLFNVFWKMISPFINPVTASKVEFVSGSKDKKKIFGKYFDMSTLETRYGGTRSDFDLSTYWQGEMTRYNKKQKKIQTILHKRTESDESMD